MRISLFSNFLNSHQLPVAKALAESVGVDFRFISYAKADGLVGRDVLDDAYDFVIPAYRGGDALSDALRRASDDDVVIMAPMDGFEPFRDARNLTGGLTFLYSERLLKRGQWWRFMPPKIARVRKRFCGFDNLTPWVLCSSAFTAADLDKFGFPSSRCLKWGYFPSLEFGGSRPRAEKLPRYMALCSAQRHIPWKHVELQLNVLQRLGRRGFEPVLRIAGDGPETPKLKSLSVKLGLEGRVEFLGQLSHRETLALMAESDVFLATSDRKEGWGATVNEAMATGCVVVGSSLMGSVPFLVRDGVDGLIFESGRVDSLEAATLRLMENPSLLPLLSSSGIGRISSTWSAESAAARLLDSCESFLSGELAPLYDDGPLSPAPILEDDWLKQKKGRPLCQ